MKAKKTSQFFANANAEMFFCEYGVLFRKSLINFIKFLRMLYRSFIFNVYNNLK